MYNVCFGHMPKSLPAVNEIKAGAKKIAKDVASDEYYKFDNVISEVSHKNATPNANYTRIDGLTESCSQPKLITHKTIGEKEKTLPPEAWYY